MSFGQNDALAEFKRKRGQGLTDAGGDPRKMLGVTRNALRDLAGQLKNRPLGPRRTLLGGSSQTQR